MFIKMENMLRNRKTLLKKHPGKTGRKGLASFVLIFAFSFISCIFIGAGKKTITTKKYASQLNKATVHNGNTERIDYIDENGIISKAEDLGYATLVITSLDIGQLREYFDEYGEPVQRSHGYSSQLRECDKYGNTIKITYYGMDGAPIIISDGYAIEKLQYDENGRILSVHYYDTKEEPICTLKYGYGYISEYDEYGNKFKETYVDLFDKPMITGKGYASVIYQLYASGDPDRGGAESEYYYDAKGEPIALSLGQYGVYKEYNEKGQGIVLTYLNAKGEPLATTKGYTTVVREFGPDNNVTTELYYDMNGNPFQMPEGQYGIQRKEGRVSYLDENGRETFNIRRMLYNYPAVIIPFVISTVIFSALMGKKQNLLFLAIYLFVIIYMTLLFRDSESAGHSGLFWYYRRILFDSRARADIIKNIWLFIPLGAILYRLYPKAIILLVPVVLSIHIEGIQLFARIGTCELDDVISNSLGSWIGFCMGRVATDIKLVINNRKQRYSA